MRLQLKISQFKLESIKRVFDFNVRWKEASNRAEIDRQRAALQIALSASAAGQDIRTIFALLVKSQPAQNLITEESGSKKLEIFGQMTPQQIVASRATETSLAHGFGVSLVEERVNFLIQQVETLKEDKQALLDNSRSKDNTLIEALNVQSQVVKSINGKKNEIIQGHCIQCKTTRTFKNGKCTMCGNIMID